MEQVEPHSPIAQTRISRALTGVRKAMNKGQKPRKNHFPYLSLPPEIRNQVMGLVLVPGEVHLRVARPRPAKESGPMMKPFHGLIDHFRIATHVSKHGPRNEPHQLPGFQLLATCKQAYSEGYELFYAMNTFFLPPGWTEHTHGHLFKTIHWKHKNLISSVGLILGLEDLIPSIFSDIRENVQHVERFLHGGRNALSGRHLAMFWGIAVGLKLSDIWMEKLALLKYLGGLESVKLVTVYQEIVVAADNVLDPQGGLGIKHYSPEIRVMLKQARKIVRRAVARKVDQDGWKSLQEWVKGGCKA